MKVHLRADEHNAEHTRVTVFCNGANCGQLCFRNYEATQFHQIVAGGCGKDVDEFVSSGKWGEAQDAARAPQQEGRE